MEILNFFRDFFGIENSDISVISFVVNIILTSAMAFVLGVFYKRFGQSLSNRSYFAANFVLLAVTTMLIITIVKSSLALSLGLVGALSIVRFRAAIKEPEELVFLFLTISIGLGMGAEQQLLTIIGFALALVLIYARSIGQEKEKTQNLVLTFNKKVNSEIDVDRVAAVLRQYCTEVELKRIDTHDAILETIFLIKFDKYSELSSSLSQIQKQFDTRRILFVAV